jgi:hypothetical protein
MGTTRVQIQGYAGVPIRSFEDWARYALPPARNELHWESDRVILSGITEQETPRPFGNRGPRCHDLALRAEQEGSAVTICIEAKADESFGGTIIRELSTARKRAAKREGGHTRFPERLDWLTTRSLLGLRAFQDAQL